MKPPVGPGQQGRFDGVGHFRSLDELNLQGPRRKDRSVGSQKSCRRLSASRSGFMTADDILTTLFLSGYVLKFDTAEAVILSIQCIATKCGPATDER